MTAVKICGLTSLKDARHAMSCSADLLGFVFVPASRRYVTPKKASAIAGALKTEGCTARLVGVFANQPLHEVQAIVDECSLDLAQLHGNENPEYAGAVGIPTIIARRVADQIPWDELSRYDSWAVLLDSYDPRRLGGTGHTWQWDLLAGSADRTAKLLVAGGLTPENVIGAIRLAKPWGVDVSSGVESAPGQKDPIKTLRFIQNVREEDSQ